ncbi:MAG: hypothetical protein GC165_16850 [Armatimonadetes bacterium]|nr:hypothetical protein [Armatimonadota bacterium]
MSLDRPLSTLELTALGIILKRGPCLAHAVVNEFAGSQTFAYRSGAGSIYPLLKRLHEAGLLECDKKHYTISEAGIQALRTWILPPFNSMDVSTNLDALRSRTYFLRLLEPSEIDLFTSTAIAELEQVLLSCQTDLETYRKTGDRFSEFAMLGAVRETEARIAWMREVQSALGRKL